MIYSTCYDSVQLDRRIIQCSDAKSATLSPCVDMPVFQFNLLMFCNYIVENVLINVLLYWFVSDYFDVPIIDFINKDGLC